MEHILIIIAITIAIATIINIGLKKFDIPTVIGYIFSGVIIATLFDFKHESREFLSHLAEFGIVFLMFTVGLEFSFKQLKNMKHEVFTIGTLQVLVTSSLLTAGGYYIFGLEVKSAIIVGLALSLSSTAIVLKMLNENGDISSGYGRKSLGVLLFQDLAVVPILLMISFFTNTDKSVGMMLLDTLGGAVVIFIGLFIFGKYVAERFFKLVTKSRSEEIFLISVLFIVIASAIFAEAAGFTYSLGAFLAGMLLSETKYRYRIEADLIPFRDIFLGIFFVTIGMMINLSSVGDYVFYIVGITFLIMSMKGMVLYVILSRFDLKRTAIKTSLALFQIGEFALAIFALANAKGLLPDSTTQILIVSVVLSMIITPFVLKNVRRLADIFDKEINPDYDVLPVVSGSYSDHTIVCGYGPIGKKIVENLKRDNKLYLILEHDDKIVEDVLAKGEEPIFLANAAQKGTFTHFNASGAECVIVAINNPVQRRLVCENLSDLSSGVRSVVKVDNDFEQELFLEMGIDTVINKEDIVANLLYDSCQK